MKARAPSGPRLITIGVYGCGEEAFFNALSQAEVDTFCDIRARRGLRGRDYAFANRRRLEARLGQMGIRYLHFKDLAPSRALRDRQSKADRAQRIGKRRRTELSKAFTTGYRREFLRSFDSRRFLDRLGAEARVVALFCVERAPGACHRSLLAEQLHRDLGLEVVHLMPA